MQGVDQQQEEIGNFGYRARDVAKRYDLRPVAVLAFPGRQERNAAPGGVAAHGAANVEVAAALTLARLAVALPQAPRDLPDQAAHLLDLPRLDPRQRRVAQDFVAQVFGLLASVQQQRLRDRIANGLAQRIQHRRQPLRESGIRHGQFVEIVAQALDAHGIEDAAGKDTALANAASSALL